MMLSDHDIRKMLDIHPDMIHPHPDDNRIQPASVDLTLGDHFIIDGLGFTLDEGELMLGPKHFILAHTQETVKIPTAFAARVEGKSSYGRQGLLVHATAGFIDPGFSGQITLELYNLSENGILLRPGDRIAQICFYIMSGLVERPYGHRDLNSKYQGQMGATASRIIPIPDGLPHTGPLFNKERSEDGA